MLRLITKTFEDIYVLANVDNITANKVRVAYSKTWWHL